MAFVDADNHEAIKGAFHGGALVLDGTMSVYNFSAWHTRRETRLLVFGMLYLGLTLFEGWMVSRHVGRL